MRGSFVDFSECSTGYHNCGLNSDCIESDEKFHCKCKEGYRGDGYDECSKNRKYILLMMLMFLNGQLTVL